MRPPNASVFRYGQLLPLAICAWAELLGGTDRLLKTKLEQLQLENYRRLLYNCWKICSATVNDLIDAGGVSVILGP